LGDGASVREKLAGWARQAALPYERYPHGLLVAAAPVSVDGRGGAWLYPGARSAEEGEERGPDLTLSQHGLSASIGSFSQQPLYYCWIADSGVLVIGTRLAPVVRAVWPRALNRVRMAALILRVDGADPGATPFEGVRRLLPGERLEVGPSGPAVRLIVPTFSREYVGGSIATLASALRQATERAVARAIEGTRRAAVLTGGGVDSGSLLALAVAHARRHGGPSIEAVTVDYDSPGCDRPYMEELARALGIQPVLRSPRDAAEHVLPSLCCDAQPGLISSDCLGLLAGKTAVERGAEAVLLGSWGDDILGPLHGFAALAHRGRVLRAVLDAARLDAPWGGSRRSRVHDLVIRPTLRAYVPAALIKWSRRKRVACRWVTEPARRDADGGHPDLAFRSIVDTPADRVASMCRSFDARVWPDALAQFATGIGRVPVDVYYDPDLVRFLSSVDPALVNCGDSFRGLFQRAMQDVVPEPVRRRRDKADFEPAITETMLASGSMEILEDLSSVSSLSGLGIVDAARFKPAASACLSVALRRKRDLYGCPEWEPFWRTVGAERFARLWGGSQPPEEGTPC
jgi:hypothetical protein